MSDTPIDSSKRTWLIATGCAGAVGGVATAVPFVSTFQPSEKAKAAGAAVEVDISQLKPGERAIVEWRGKPVWIIKRTPEQLADLPALDAQLADPKSERKPDEFTPAYARNGHRSIKPEVLVAVGICPISGGVFREGYSIEGPLDRYIPVDVNVPGCPPRPQAILEAVVLARSIWMKKLGLEE